MRTKREIKAEIRALKRDMKARGLKVMSFLNRQEPAQARANERLYALKLELEKSS